jgi:prepilin-type N-terminal cleavage/methylation domain-containing protein
VAKLLYDDNDFGKCRGVMEAARMMTTRHQDQIKSTKMTRNPSTRNSRRGFTLIELLVVIAIIAILAAILFPVFAQAKMAAKKTATMSNMKNLGMSVQLYIGDYDGVYLEAVQGGCFGQATAVNTLWGRSLHPYVKNKDVYLDQTAALKKAGFRFASSVPLPELGEIANPPPCNDNNTDRRVQPIGINRIFLSYFQCDPVSSGGTQIGCKNVAWDPVFQGFGDCGGNFTNEGLIQESAKYVIYATTSTTCAAGSQGYIASAQAAVNLIDGLTSRLGSGLTLTFADTHAKWYPSRKDPQVTAAYGGNGSVEYSPVQNRRAVIMRGQGAGNFTNGVLNCVNHNPAGLHWNVWAALPGENAAVDTLCNSLP